MIKITSNFYSYEFVNRIAELTKENLQSQRQGLKAIQQRMNTLVRKLRKIKCSYMYSKASINIKLKEC